MKDGVIKYNCEWKKKPLPENLNISELIKYRNKLYTHGLIGSDKNGIGYGNISTRYNPTGKFIISASATGNLKSARKLHFTLVNSVDTKKNFVSCTGMKAASSESMTHSIIYTLSPNIKSVIHIHNLRLWKKLLNKVPTTTKDITYGTPEMGNDIKRLWLTSELKQKKIIIMSGHKTGIIVFSESIASAYNLLMEYIV